MNILIVEKDITEINLIKQLWEQLNSVHMDTSVHFKDKYENFSFEKRLESIYKKAQKGIFKLDLLFDKDTEDYIGYCLSSIEGSLGEIESIFIEKKYRKLKLGDMLMMSALNWFEINSIKDIQIGVVYANEEALPFYERYGFHIARYVLKRN